MTVAEDFLSEAELDLERRVASLRADLAFASEAAEDVLDRLTKLRVSKSASKHVHARASSISRACQTARAAISAPGTGHGSRPIPPAAAPSAASTSSEAVLTTCAVEEGSAARSHVDAPQPEADACIGLNGRVDMGRLQLARPLVAFDLETTGLDTKRDRIVEFAAVRLDPDGSCAMLRHLLHPGVPMPAAAANTHRITDAHVAGKPRFAALAAEIAYFFAGADILGYNALRFDVPLLATEFARVSGGGGSGNCGRSCGGGGGSGSRSTCGGRDGGGGSNRLPTNFEFPSPGTHVVDALVVFKRAHNFKLASAHRLFCGSDMQNAHTALADAAATLKVLLGQLNYFPGLANTVPALHELCSAPPKAKYLDPKRRFKWLDGQAAFAFGKYAGFALAQAAASDAGYLEWLSQRDFGEEANRIIADARRGVFPQPPPP